jgi:prefoldin subunit 5
MNLGQFYKLTSFLVDAYDKGAIETAYQQVLNAIQNQISSPNQTQLEAVSTSLESLRKAVVKANFASMPPTWKPMVAELDIENFVGDVIHSWAKRKVAESGPLLTESMSALQTDFNSMQQTYAHLRQAREALKYLEYPIETLEEGQAEVLIELPRSLFGNEVSDLAAKMRIFDQVVSTCAEVATGSAEKILLKEISTTDPIIVALATPATVLFVLKVVNQILDAYKKVVEIREIQARTKEIGLGADFQKKLSDEAEKIIRISLEDFVKEVKKERKIANDLNEKLKLMMFKLAALIDHGARVEGWAKLTKKKEDDSEDAVAERNNDLAEIQRISSEIRKFRVKGDPILNLPPPQE